MRNRLPASCCLIAIAAHFSTPSFAQEQLAQLDTMTIYGTKSPIDTFDYPGMVTVIDADDPAVAGSTTVKGLLKDIAGLEVGGSARRNGKTLTLRGFDTEGLVILVDGVRQKFEAAHDGKFFIDPNLMKRVEVIRGPSSALYGSGALGGVIAFETKDVADLLAPGETWGAMTSLGYETVNDEWLISQAGYLQHGDVDLLASWSKRQSDDIELPDGTDLVASDDIDSILVKAGWQISESSKLKLNLQRFSNDSTEPNNPQTTIGSDLFDKETTSDLTSLTYNFNPNNPYINLTTLAYYNQIEVDENDILTARSLSRELETKGLNVENQSLFQLSDNHSHTFTYGVEYYTEEQNGKDTSTTSGEAGGIPDAETDYWGVFIQDEIKLNTAMGEFLLTPGVRYDNYESENTTGLDLDESEVSPKLGISYKPVEWLVLFGNYAEAFRAPTMTEVYTTGVHFAIPGFGINSFVPNPDLKPERNESTEFGFGMNFNDVFSPQDQLKFKVAHFDIDSEDFIDTLVVQPGPPACFPPNCNGTTTSVNIADASIRGYELEGGYENNRVRVNVAYSQTHGRNDDTREFLTNIQPKTTVLNWTIKLPEIDSVVGMRSTYAGTHDKVNTVGAERDAFDVHDVYVEWQAMSMDGLVVNLGINNMFDEEYARVFGGTLEPGRNYRAQLSYQW